MFSSDEEEDAGGLSPVKDDDEVWRKQTRKALMSFNKEEYEIRERFDLTRHPQENGERTELEKRVDAIEKRFAEIYEREEEVFGTRAQGFKTPQGTRFVVNAIHEWQAVFLEYDDGEDGDMIPLKDYDTERMFGMLHEEILRAELDERRALENAYRIFKTEWSEDGLCIWFRFWKDSDAAEDLYSRQSVLIDGSTYRYKRCGDSIQKVVLDGDVDGDLYDHWIQFV